MSNNKVHPALGGMCSGPGKDVITETGVRAIGRLTWLSAKSLGWHQVRTFVTELSWDHQQAVGLHWNSSGPCWFLKIMAEVLNCQCLAEGRGFLECLAIPLAGQLKLLKGYLLLCKFVWTQTICTKGIKTRQGLFSPKPLKHFPVKNLHLCIYHSAVQF